MVSVKPYHHLLCDCIDVCAQLRLQEHQISERFPKMTPSMFSKSFCTESQRSFPRLKGRAAWVKTLIPALLSVFTYHMDRHNVQHKQVRLALQKLIQIEEILEIHQASTKVPHADADALVKLARDFCLLNSGLARFFHTDGIFLFNVTIKFHYLLHCMYFSRYLHPAKAWCYGGESLLKHVRRLILSNASGTRLHKINDKVMASYLRGLQISLSGDRGLALVR